MRNITGVLILGVSVLTVTPLSAHADGCSNSSLVGAYGYAETLTQDNNTPPFFGETVGIMRFDGRGNGTSAQDYARSDGQGTRFSGGPLTLTYSVTSDCHFTFTWQNGETFSGVIVRDTQELLYIETSGNAFGTAIIRRGRAVKIHTS